MIKSLFQGAARDCMLFKDLLLSKHLWEFAGGHLSAKCVNDVLLQTDINTLCAEKKVRCGPKLHSHVLIIVLVCSLLQLDNSRICNILGALDLTSKAEVDTQPRQG